MRRLLPVVLAALLAVLLVLPAGAASAEVIDTTHTAAADVLLLAVEGEEGEPAGPQPTLQNTNAPPEYQPPFLINAAFLLTALMLALTVAVAGLYYVLVHRPRQAQGG